MEDIVEILLQAGELMLVESTRSPGFDLSRALFQEIVKLVARLRFRPAGAPSFAIDVDQAGFAGGHAACAATNAGAAID